MLKGFVIAAMVASLSSVAAAQQQQPAAPDPLVEAQMRALQQEDRAVQAEAKLMMQQQQASAQIEGLKRVASAHPALGDWQQVAAFYADQIRSLRQGKSPQ